MRGISFGSDPEFMIYDREGRIRSAIGIVRGTKDKKLDLGNGNSMFYDNVNLEVNLRPGSSSGEVVNNFMDCFSRVSAHITPYTFAPVASHVHPDSNLSHKDAKVFGCDPEYCAYTLGIINPPAGTDGFRSAGGHIHLGSTPGTPPLMAPFTEEDTSERDWGRVRVVRMLDLFLGVPSVLMDQDPTSAARRRLYGKAGSHRPKNDYGVEYRSMGNFWLASPNLVRLVFDISLWVVAFVRDGGYTNFWQDETCKGYSVDEVRAAIDGTNRPLAGDIMNKVVKKYMPENLFQQIFAAAEPTRYNFYREWGM